MAPETVTAPEVVTAPGTGGLIEVLAISFSRIGLTRLQDRDAGTLRRTEGGSASCPIRP
jgi:hypothetical protein